MLDGSAPLDHRMSSSSHHASSTHVFTHADYPRVVCEDIVRLRRCITRSGIPGRRTDENLLIGTWNIRHLGALHVDWDENPGSPKRNLRSLAYIAEVIRHFDVIAIQEIKRETVALRYLMDEFLGPDWGVLLSDVSGGQRGNSERLGYLYDKRRVSPSGLAGEIVLAPTSGFEPVEQFDRTPFVVGFRAGRDRFSLLTAHIRYGQKPLDRQAEVAQFAAYTARELRARARLATGEESNLIVLGDFNIDRRHEDDPLFAAFVAAGLMVPEPIRDVQTNYAQTVKHYDQIAWFMGDLTLLTRGAAGVIDFRGSVYRELTARQVTDRVSDHLPLWVEFVIDRSQEELRLKLRLDPLAEDPFAAIPD